MVGIPGAGKTTYARCNLGHAIRICLDDLRLMLSGHAFAPAIEPVVAVAADALRDSLAEVHLHCSLALAQRRNASRPNPVPAYIVEGFFRRLEPPTREEGFAEVIDVFVDEDSPA